jgi:hypothetical protein
MTKRKMRKYEIMRTEPLTHIFCYFMQHKLLSDTGYGLSQWTIDCAIGPFVAKGHFNAHQVDGIRSIAENGGTVQGAISWVFGLDSKPVG